MNNRKSYGLSIGASSILIVIVILCLVCFAGLSIASADADYRLSKKLADRTTDYYAACNEAQLKIMSMCENEDKIKESLSDSLTFTCFINENQSLEVTVVPVHSDNADNCLYEISSWRVITLSLPELDNSLPIFLGN